MQRVERHIILNNKQLDNLTFLSKNLYNYVNYLVRQNFIKTREMLSEYGITTQLTKENQVDYRALPAQTSQQTIKLLFRNWDSFFRSIKNYKENPGKYRGRPKLPKYKKKKGHNIVVFTNQQAKLKDGFIHFPEKAGLLPLKTKVDNICQVRIVPKINHHIIEIVYEKEKKSTNLDENLYLGIDLGLNNLVSTSNNAGLQPFIINGKILKSINQYFNKKRAKLMSFVGDRGTSNRIEKLTFKRNNKVNDYIHKTTRFIIDYCVENKIKNIVVGYNKGWKNEINIGKRNNQSFVSIPFQKLVDQLGYKGEEVGINVIINEESYTSKCSALDLEPIKKHEFYLGKRVKRGLFKTLKGLLINADVNGSLNILRKVIGDDFINLLNIGLAYNPFKVNNFNKI